MNLKINDVCVIVDASYSIGFKEGELVVASGAQFGYTTEVEGNWGGEYNTRWACYPWRLEKIGEL